MNKTGTSYLLCLTWVFGVAGLHRFYNGKPVSGVLWLLTWGFLGVGQFFDLFLIPEMVEEHNYKLRARLGMSPTGVPLHQPNIQVVLPPEAIAVHSPAQAAPSQSQVPPTKQQIMLRLLKAAAGRDGKLSVTQAVLDTELDFEAVETTLKEMVKTGYVAIENHPATGVVVYNFLEL